MQALVGQTVVPTTIKDLAGFPAPDRRDPSFQQHRFKPVEVTIYRVEGTLTEYKKEERSGVYHLILSDDDGETMIAVAADPDAVAPSSRWAKEIAAVR